MAERSAIYSNYSDELARTATVSLETGTAQDTYGVERLVDDNPAHLFKANETNVGIQISFEEPTPIGILALIHTTLEVNDDVRILGDNGATPDWDYPAFDIPFPQSGWRGDGVTRWPINSWINLSEEAEYDVYGYTNYLLTFGRTSALQQPLQIGNIRMHPPPLKRLYLDRDPVERRSKPNIENRTAYGVSTIYPRGTTLWGFKYGNRMLDDDEREEIWAHWSDVDGRTYPWLFIPHPDEAPCYLVRYETTEEEIQRACDGLTRFTGAVQEVGRGLRPGV